MAKVDPFVIQWPQKWMADNEIRPVIEYLNRHLHDLFIRTGGGEDLVDDNEQAITSTNSNVSRNASLINGLVRDDFELIITDQDLTTGLNQIIICTNTVDIEITLDPQAIIEDEVHIKRTDKKVNVIGLIDGKTNKVINIRYYSMHLVFNGTEWSEI